VDAERTIDGQRIDLTSPQLSTYFSRMTPWL
jgi:hypothetical protein